MHRLEYRVDLEDGDDEPPAPTRRQQSTRQQQQALFNASDVDDADDPFAEEVASPTSLKQPIQPQQASKSFLDIIEIDFTHDDEATTDAANDGDGGIAVGAASSSSGGSSRFIRLIRQCNDAMPWSGWGPLVRVVPREYWLLLLVTLISSYSYFLVSLNLTTFLSSEFGFSDTDAGFLYGLYGACTFVALSLGFVVDYLGVKRTIILAAIIRLFGVVLATTAQHWSMLLVSITLFLPIADSWAYPVYTIAIKRYTTTAVRPMSYGLYYSVGIIRSSCSLIDPNNRNDDGIVNQYRSTARWNHLINTTHHTRMCHCKEL